MVGRSILVPVLATILGTAAVSATSHLQHLPNGRLLYRGDVYIKESSVAAPPLHSCDDDMYLTYACAPTKYMTAVVSVFLLVCLAGAMSGLTVGVLSLDKLHLTVLKMEGSATSQVAAARLLPVLRNHRLVLVTLVIMNALANEALPIFLNTLINPIASVVFSVTFVVLFGEIVPTALCTGERQLVIGAACVPLLQGLIRLAYPIAYPISVLLHYTVGECSSNMHYSRNELKALVHLQHLHNPRAGLSLDDVDLIHAILDLGNHTAQHAMAHATAPLTPSLRPPDVPDSSLQVTLPDNRLRFVHRATLFEVPTPGVRTCLRVGPDMPLSTVLKRWLQRPDYSTVVLVEDAMSHDVLGALAAPDLLVAKQKPPPGRATSLALMAPLVGASPLQGGGDVELTASSHTKKNGYARVCLVRDEAGTVVTTAATCS
ncbi:Aste57867_9564 [Aphanomyces stellatus]|uniref:Aste57867_9564 protein n=1 Tax=Aphanomyces stellatus TaxID=120398 RepID=A0A485KNQ0_9STRA|nr:hypothetical protein As57867_009526 [Aphanomyces stellatus]VFT86443.1 Aste57867_9564 [Aphanomyces stellatus]